MTAVQQWWLAGKVGRGLASVEGDWTERSVPVMQSWQYVCWSETLGLFVMVGNGDKGAVSSDGINWTLVNMPSYASWSRVCWCPQIGLFVCTGFESNKAATSPDGINWTARTLPSSGKWAGLAWNGNTLISVDNNGNTGSRLAIHSTDGINWTSYPAALPSVASWDGLVWAPQLGLWVCIANNSNKAATSPDGINWTQHTLPLNTYWVDIAWSGTHFVASDYSEGGVSHCARSDDGVNWTLVTGLPVSTRWGGVAWNQTVRLFCMVGNGTQSLFSPDGLTWAADPMPANTTWYKLVWGNGAGVFVALPEAFSSIVASKRFT